MNLISHGKEVKVFAGNSNLPLAKAICEKLGFDSLGYQSLDGLLESIGLDRDKVCPACWNGKEYRS